MTDVRPATIADLDRLDAIEAASDVVLFSALGVPVPSGATLEVPRARCVLVSGDPPVGFAWIAELDGEAHLQSLAVEPAAMRQGVGRALLRASLAWARERGYTRMTLTTYADVPFNAPFYASEGFVPAEDCQPDLLAARRHEVDVGLDALGQRTAMVSNLSTAPVGLRR